MRRKNKDKIQPISPVTGKPTDPMFDGHLEKPLSKMTPREKLMYLWLQTEFKWKIKDRKIVKRNSNMT